MSDRRGPGEEVEGHDCTSFVVGRLIAWAGLVALVRKGSMRQRRRDAKPRGERQSAACRPGIATAHASPLARLREGAREGADVDAEKNFRISHRLAVTSETADGLGPQVAGQFAKSEHVLGPESMDCSVVAVRQLSRSHSVCVNRETLFPRIRMGIAPHPMLKRS